MKTNKTLVVAIYSHPEYYPPTLNALEILSGFYDKIFVLHRNIEGFDWKYPANVQLVAPSSLYSVRVVEKSSFVKKVGWFLLFCYRFLRLLWKTRPDSILLYDSLAVLGYRVVKMFAKQAPVCWYHNHDVSEEKYIRKYSLSWWAWKSEPWLFRQLTIFSLPAMERKMYFPMEQLKGQFFFLPNFPSKNIYNSYRKAGKSRDAAIKLLYQGSIGELHGLEEIISILGEKISNRSLHLVLKGFVDPAYLDKLYEIGRNLGVEKQIQYIPPSGYREVIENAFNCDIGIGIHKKSDIMNQTLGTASNKIYEYAAAGMPVLLYDNEHFRSTLEGKEWVFFTDTTGDSLKEIVSTIIDSYDSLSAMAMNDFNKNMNFENSFNKVTEYLFNGAKKN
jgi:glycosyltransferase involved in cell wall biosynthesis